MISFKIRTRWMLVGLCCIFSVIMIKFAWLQIVRGPELRGMVMADAADNSVKQTPRGKILDRNGRELAISRMAKTLTANPSKVKDTGLMASQLAAILNLKESELKADLDAGGGFLYVKRRMEVEEEEAVRQLIKENKYGDCLNLEDEVKRYYPNDMLAANIIGFIGTDDKGLEGIENEFDSLLKGDAQKQNNIVDPQERRISDSLFIDSSYRGDQCKSVTLTIDSTVQFIVEQVLDKAMLTAKPKAITAVVMDPKTGEVLAMANRPSFNPNKYADSKPDAHVNRGVSFTYEPGSTFKSVVAASALQDGIVTPNTAFADGGSIYVSEHTIQNWDGEGNGTITFTDAVKNSVNTVFAQVAMQLGGVKLTNYAKNFGFGKATGIELPGEEDGMLFDEPEEMVASDVATMGIGQSITVTPIQLVRAMSAMVNGGTLLQPHIVKHITNADGSVYKEFNREEIRRVIDPEKDKQLVYMLEQVVATGGGGKAKIKGYRIGGKTGTAQKINDNGIGYKDGSYIASFCGFAPVEDPRLVVLVMIDDPSGVFYGGQVAAPVARDIFVQLFRYLHIEPSSDPFSDNDKRTNNTPYYTESNRERRVIKPSDDGKAVVPDVIGLSIREATEYMEEAGLSIDVQGSGKATLQGTKAWATVPAGTTITVTFNP